MNYEMYSLSKLDALQYVRSYNEESDSSAVLGVYNDLIEKILFPKFQKYVPPVKIKTDPLEFIQPQKEKEPFDSKILTLETEARQASIISSWDEEHIDKIFCKMFNSLNEYRNKK
jgi:hypothetical protein